MDRNEIINWLMEQDNERLENLWQIADATREENVGDDVHLRGIIEISNHCIRKCTYCGINTTNTDVERYRMTRSEILVTAREISSCRYGTVVIQAGEDYQLGKEWICRLIQDIKQETGLAVTLSLGERKKAELEAWKKCGADRYLLKIETGNPELFKKIHPSALESVWENRVELLRFLMDTGYETGSGIMVGIPGQTYEDIANDLLLFKELGLHMLGIGPYLPHPGTALGQEYEEAMQNETQVTNTELMTYKVNALARILCPKANIPTTSALATVNTASGRELGLQRGANVVMPNFTPLKYRKCYEIYPQRVCLTEHGQGLKEAIENRIQSIGRIVGTGAGSAIKKSFSGCLYV